MRTYVLNKLLVRCTKEILKDGAVYFSIHVATPHNFHGGLLDSEVPQRLM